MRSQKHRLSEKRSFFDSLRHPFGCLFLVAAPYSVIVVRNAGFRSRPEQVCDSLLVLDGVIEMRTVRECAPWLQAGKRHVKILVRAPDGEVRGNPRIPSSPGGCFSCCRWTRGGRSVPQSLPHRTQRAHAKICSLPPSSGRRMRSAVSITSSSVTIRVSASVPSKSTK